MEVGLNDNGKEENKRIKEESTRGQRSAEVGRAGMWLTGGAVPNRHKTLRSIHNTAERMSLMPT